MVDQLLLHLHQVRGMGAVLTLYLIELQYCVGNTRMLSVTRKRNSKIPNCDETQSWLQTILRFLNLFIARTNRPEIGSQHSVHFWILETNECDVLADISLLQILRHIGNIPDAVARGGY